MKKELTNLYKIPINKIKVIANGIDKNRFKPKKSTSSYYLYVGRFDKKKGINVLIDAYQKVANKLSKPLYLVGKEGGLSLSDIKQQVKTKKIKIITGKTNKDVVKFYQNAHYSIFPSLYEPFGIVAIESLACGTPFIASSGGFIEINNKTKAGLIFKPKNTKELSQLLIKVDKNNNLRKKLVQKGLKTVKNYYWENIYKDYINLFKKSV